MRLNPLWLANVPGMTTLLFQAVRDTLGTLLADPKYLGAQPGILAALHTWSQTLVLHPHLHCLVTGGGLTPAGQWVAVRHGFLLPARVVMAVFRGKMVAAIRQTLVRGALALPEPMRPQQVLNLLNRLGHPTKTKWHVRIMERYHHGAGVVTYVARYLRGGPLKNAVWWHTTAPTSPSPIARGRRKPTRGQPLPDDDVARGGLSATVAPPCPSAPDARGAVLWPVSSCIRRGLGRLPHGTWKPPVEVLCWTGRRCVRSVVRPILSGVPPAGRGWYAPGSSRAGVHPRPW